MSRFTDQDYLKHDQYADAHNLDARVSLHQRFSTNPQGWFNWVFDTLEQLPELARVLELGCGPGHLWSTCSRRIPPGWVITLSDLSEGMLLAAWRNLVVTGRAFKYEQIDARSIPYPDESFDIIIANHMLYHISDRPKALGEIHRTLKPGGRLVATTVGRQHLKELGDWYKRLGLDDPASGNQFVLENGLEQLQPFFEQVEIRRYADGLRITELAPLMTYLRSSAGIDEVPESALRALEQELADKLARKGEILVTKDSGLFLALK